MSLVVFAAGCGGDGGDATRVESTGGFAAAAAAATAEQQETIESNALGAQMADVRSDRDSLRGNTAPSVTQVEVIRAEPESWSDSSAERWRAVAEGRDADGDSIRFSYRWILNGEETDENDEYFPMDRLVAGDRLQVQVTADDGVAQSVPLRSGSIEIGNRAPEIVSRPPRPDATGRFRYSIQAEDPDGETDLVFTLERGPEGMSIDSKSGLVTWQPTVSQAGQHEIEVGVHDSKGAKATQSFRIALIKQVGDAPPAAAR